MCEVNFREWPIMRFFNENKKLSRMERKLLRHIFRNTSETEKEKKKSLFKNFVGINFCEFGKKKKKCDVAKLSPFPVYDKEKDTFKASLILL